MLIGAKGDSGSLVPAQENFKCTFPIIIHGVAGVFLLEKLQ